MIQDLQEAKIGDPRRLAYILDRIENSRTIYNSDEHYVREKFRQFREELTCGPDNDPDQTRVPDNDPDQTRVPDNDPDQTRVPDNDPDQTRVPDNDPDQTRVPDNDPDQTRVPDNDPDQTRVPDNDPLDPPKPKNNGATKVVLIASLLFLIPVPIIGIIHDTSPGRYMSQSSLIGLVLWIVFWLGMTLIMIGRLRPKWMNKLLVFEGVVALLASVFVASDSTPIQSQLLLVGIGVGSIAFAIIRRRRKSWSATSSFPPMRWLQKINSPKRAILVIFLAFVVFVGAGQVALYTWEIPDPNADEIMLEQQREQQHNAFTQEQAKAVNACSDSGWAQDHKEYCCNFAAHLYPVWCGYGAP